MRWQALVPVLVACALAAAATAADNPLGIPTFPIAHGTWSGHPWTLMAGDRLSGGMFSACVSVKVAGAPKGGGSGGCNSGSIPTAHPNPAPPSGFGYGIGFNASSDCPLLIAVSGTVPSAAAHVTLRFANGRAETVPTIAPPRGFVPGVKFFAAAAPCDVRPTGLVATTAAGVVVGRMPERFLRFP